MSTKLEFRAVDCHEQCDPYGAYIIVMQCYYSLTIHEGIYVLVGTPATSDALTSAGLIPAALW